MWEQIAPQVMDSLVMVLIALISLVCAVATGYLKKLAAVAKVEAAAIQDSTQQELINKSIDLYKDLVLTVVGKIEETTAKQIRAAVRDGTVNRDELVDLSRQAYEEIIATAQPELIEAVNTQIYDLKAYTLGLIENAVRDVKAKGEDSIV